MAYGRGIGAACSSSGSLERQDGDAMMQLGWMYETGTGVPQSDAEALRLYGMAAERRSSAGLRSLGVMYANGHGVVKS